MRLVTRGDVDGIMCATLLKAAGIIDETQFDDIEEETSEAED